MITNRILLVVANLSLASSTLKLEVYTLKGLGLRYKFLVRFLEVVINRP
ncbi:uncharacterized protein RAG0_02041 [Rhynchosporium agropyri]|uniref:Uncharacterized protein n=1 Tax=Rhynchosporium agropyri TaxID=914238 RepID=A0A1E1JZV3_9HELO|nr:uncharacterized protein RAG0_02041 [Rhynchosporium agropyri]